MLPVGASASNPTAMSANGIAISTEWEIHSSLSPNALKSWVAGALKPDFTRTSDLGDGLWFAKYDIKV
jgi:hypothetical protein